MADMGAWDRPESWAPPGGPRSEPGQPLAGPGPFVTRLLWALWDPLKQTWHDMMVGTAVIPTDSED